MKVLTGMQVSSLLQTSESSRGVAQRSTLSPACSLPAGVCQLQPWPCSYCWGKQKTTAMQHQTGLHHVYEMTESWASLQRGWGSLRQLRQFFHIQGCASEAVRAGKALSSHCIQVFCFIRRPRDGSELAMITQSIEIWFKTHGREGARLRLSFLGKGRKKDYIKFKFRFTCDCSQLLLPLLSSCQISCWC
jgi:hypothetical protein